MPNAKTENQLKIARIVGRKIGRTLAFLINGISLCLVVIMPFILIEDQNNPAFWQSVGCYGIFLIGVAAVVNLFSSSRFRFRD